MNIESLSSFLGWCSVINMALLLLSFLMMVLAKDLAYSMHAKIFHISKEEVGASIYRVLAMYKILIFFFNIVPYIVLQIL